jgi:thiol-disulfide isomerase/thioredoxin
MKIKYFFFVLVLGILPALNPLFAQKKDATFASVKLQTLQGETTRLLNYFGDITIINFWSTWAAPCVKEMPALEKIYREYHGQNIKVVGISVYSDPTKITKMLRLTKVSYPILIASKAQTAHFGNLSSIPQTLIVDANGRILKRFEGGQSFQTLNAALESLLTNKIISRNNN